mgnify:CR=1 FL=1
MSRPPGAEPHVAVAGAAGPACAALAQGLRRERPRVIVQLFSTLPGPAFDLTLLCAEDRPSAPEMRLRAALMQAGMAFQVLHGPPQAQLRQALEAIDLIAARASSMGVSALFNPENPHRLRSWSCEKCSDPECEHRLFQELLAGSRDGAS